jgi:uncharacterized lipoprotein YajG
MIKNLFLLAAIVLLTACNFGTNANTETSTDETVIIEAADSIIVEEVEVSTSTATD